MTEQVNKEQVAESLVISSMMQHQDIRKFLHEYISGCGVYETAFNNDPYQHSFNAGMRAAGLRLERELKENAPGDYIRMIKESLDER